MNTTPISPMDVSRADLVSHLTRLRDMESYSGQRNNSYQPILDRLELTAGDNMAEITRSHQTDMKAFRDLGMATMLTGGFGMAAGIALNHLLPGVGPALTLLGGLAVMGTTLSGMIANERSIEFTTALHIGAEYIAEDRANGTLAIMDLA
jgi:hypothetical protein